MEEDESGLITPRPGSRASNERRPEYHDIRSASDDKDLGYWSGGSEDLKDEHKEPLNKGSHITAQPGRSTDQPGKPASGESKEDDGLTSTGKLVHFHQDTTAPDLV